MKSVLFVSYYFPPQGLSGVLRSLKFVKYLPECGFRPVVLAAEGFGFMARDRGLLKDIPPEAILKKVRVREPYSVAPGRVLSRRTRDAATRLSSWFSFPDTRVLWTISGFGPGLRLIERHRARAIVATSPPWSSLILGARLARKTGLPLVLDYRDLWEGNFERHYPSPAHRALNLSLEKRVLKRASAVVAINPAMADILSGRFGVDPVVISQGYDPEDFPGRPPPSGDTLSILHAGSLVRRRDPEPLLRGLALFRRERPHARVRLTFMGVSSYPTERMARALGVSDAVDILPYASHGRACALMEEHHLLLVLIGRGEGPEVSTSKAYEYLGARRSVLVASPPHTDAFRMISQRGGYTCPPDDPEAIALALSGIYDDFRHGAMILPRGVEDFSAPRRTAHLAELLSSLV